MSYRSSYLAVSLLISAGACGCAGQTNDASIRTSEGPIAGSTEDGVRAFKGIPYAAPPVGNLRWKPPQPATPWKEVRSATAYAPICIQPGGAATAEGFYGGGARPRVQSEDCLYLNVWSTGAPSGARPVMMWVHGGGMLAGSASNPEYDGANLARKGVVVVTVGYRLGVLGFLALPELSGESEHQVSGNYGILDLIAALKWINRNIAAFGGDPHNVTVFGQSGGSWGVCYLAATPLAKGLLQRGIGESGCTFDRDPRLKEAGLPNWNAAGTTFTFESAETLGEQWVNRAFHEPVKLDALRAKPASDFAKAIENRPNIDGWVFPHDLYVTFVNHQQNPITILGGNTADEGSVVTRAMPDEPKPGSLEAYKKLLEKQYGPEITADLVKQYRLNSDADVRRGMEEIFRESRQVWEMRELVRLTRQSHYPAYLYYFTRVPPGMNAERMGAYHAAEIPYAFGNLIDKRRPYTEVDHKLSGIISSYWVNFARTGNPNGPDLPKWPMFELSDQLCQELGVEVKTIPAPHKAAIEIFDRYEAPRLAKEK